MRQIASVSRLGFLAGTVALLGLLALHPREASSQISFGDYLYGSHGGPTYALSSVDPATDEWLSWSDVSGVKLRDMACHPSNVNPEWILAQVPGGNLRRVNPNQGVIDTITNTIGTSKAAIYVNSPPLKPHYVVGEDYSYSLGSLAMEMMQPEPPTIVEQFALGGGISPNDTRMTGVAFTRTDVGGDGNPGNDYFRYWYFYKSSSLTAGTLGCLDLRHEHIIQPSDPWNPVPGTQYGPPYPSLPAQVDFSGRLQDSVYTGGTYDETVTMRAWRHPTTGANYVFVAYNVLLSTTPLVIGTQVDIFDADQNDALADLLPSTIAPAQSLIVDAASMPPFRQMEIIGNYMFVTSGVNPMGQYGGSAVYYYYLPPLPGAPGARGNAGALGCTGIGTDFDVETLYIGGDDGTNRYRAGEIVNPGLLTDVANPCPTLVLHNAMTQEESQSMNPPQRVHTGYDWVSFVIDLDTVATFPGRGTGVGRRSRKGACSGALLTADGGGGIFGLAMSLFLIGLLGATLREAARSRT